MHRYNGDKQFIVGRPYYDLREILRPNGLHRLFTTPAVNPKFPM